MSHPATQHPSQVASHLEPEVWAKVNRLLVRKAISEYAHEWLLEPERLGPSDRPGFDRYRLTLAEGAEYRFDAQIMAMRHWRIPPESITKTVAGAPAPLDALQFVIEVRDRLALPADRLPIYLDEITSTLHGSAYKHGRAAPQRRRAGAGRLPDHRDLDDRGPPQLRRQQRPPGLRRRGLPRLRPRGRRADPRDVAGGAQGQRALRLPVRHGL